MLLLKLGLLDQILDVANGLWVGVLEILIQQKVEEQRILAKLLSACQPLQKLLLVEELVLSLSCLTEELGSLQKLSKQALQQQLVLLEVLLLKQVWVLLLLLKAACLVLQMVQDFLPQLLYLLSDDVFGLPLILQFVELLLSRVCS